MVEEVTIPKKEYEVLLKCRELLEIERDEDFRPELLEKLKKAEKSIKVGKGKRFRTREEVERYLRSL